MTATTTQDIHVPYGEPSSSPSSSSPPSRQHGTSTRALYSLILLFIAGAYVVFADFVNITISDHQNVRRNTAPYPQQQQQQPEPMITKSATAESRKDTTLSSESRNKEDNDNNSSKEDHSLSTAEAILQKRDLNETDVDMIQAPLAATPLQISPGNDGFFATESVNNVRQQMLDRISSNKDNNNDGHDVVLGGSNSFTRNNNNNNNNNRFTARDYYPNHMPVPSWMETYIEFHRQQLEDPKLA